MRRECNGRRSGSAVERASRRAARGPAHLDPALALGHVEAEVRREGEVAVVRVRADAAARAHAREEGLEARHLPPARRRPSGCGSVRRGRDAGGIVGTKGPWRACCGYIYCRLVTDSGGLWRAGAGGTWSSRRRREVSGKHSTFASSHTQRSMSASVFQSPP